MVCAEPAMLREALLKRVTATMHGFVLWFDVGFLTDDPSGLRLGTGPEDEFVLPFFASPPLVTHADRSGGRPTGPKL